MSSKRQQTMAKLTRERTVKERRERKQEKKRERKLAAAAERDGLVAPDSEASEVADGITDPMPGIAGPELSDTTITDTTP